MERARMAQDRFRGMEGQGKQRLTPWAILTHSGYILAHVSRGVYIDWPGLYRTPYAWPVSSGIEPGVERDYPQWVNMFHSEGKSLPIGRSERGALLQTKGVDFGMLLAIVLVYGSGWCGPRQAASNRASAGRAG